MSVADVRTVLDVLRKFYADRDGRPHTLNETQLAVYLDGLSGFDGPTLEAAARAHMKASAFFPRLSELLAILRPAVDLAALAHVAWAQLERDCRSIGAYRPVEFVDPAFGHTVRQVFGSWASACSFDLDSPGWAIRRQTFLAIFPVMAARTALAPVRLGGLHRDAPVAMVGHLEGLPEPVAPEALPDRSRSVLAEVERRFLARAGAQ